MIQLIAASSRGHFNFDWLNTYHTFSFGDYYNPNAMGFSVLRVINEDIVAPYTGFNTHGHKDMEIITYVISGELSHEDTLGNKSIIRPGEVQRMSAGRGIRHSEKNNTGQPVHLYQIWILPEAKNLDPGYGQKSFTKLLDSQSLTLTVSKNAEQESIGIQQDIKMYIGRLKADQELICPTQGHRNAWMQVVKGQLLAGQRTLNASDALAISQEGQLKILAKADSEFILFDLP